ncbi:MAG: TniQ family protein, partial [Alkalilacustris sp.]
MLKLLPIRTAPMPRETLPSFLSRLAAMNGVTATDFAVDLGVSL